MMPIARLPSLDIVNAYQLIVVVAGTMTLPVTILLVLGVYDTGLPYCGAARIYEPLLLKAVNSYPGDDPELDGNVTDFHEINDGRVVGAAVGEAVYVVVLRFTNNPPDD